MSYSPISALRKIARDYNAKLEIDEHHSGDYIDCFLIGGGMDIYVTVTRCDDDYFAYNLESSHLLREIYADSIGNAGFIEKDRNQEILENIQLLFARDLLFYPKSSIFNKRRGYIILDSDGAKTKLFLKDNSLNLKRV